MLLGGGWMLHAKPFFYYPALFCHSIPLLWEGIGYLFFLSSNTSIIFHCSINPCFWEGGWMLHAKLFFYHLALPCHCSINACFWEGVDVACPAFLVSSCIALSFHTTRKNYSTLIHSFGRWLILYIYIYTYQYFFQEPLLATLLSLPFHPFRRCHPSLPYLPMLLGGGGCCMPSFSFIILHCSVIPYFLEKYITHSFDRGPNFIYIYIYISFKNLVYHPSCPSHSTLLEKCHSTTHSFLQGLSSLCFSRISSIIFHCSLNPCFWEGVDVACPTFLLSSCIAPSFHTTRKNYSTLIHSFRRGLTLYIYIHFFQKSLLSSCIALSIHAFRRGCMLHSKLFFYRPAWLCHSILVTRAKTILPLFTPLGGGWL